MTLSLPKEFEPINSDLQRLRVPGGWLVCPTCAPQACTFVPDPDHAWEPCDEELPAVVVTKRIPAGNEGQTQEVVAPFESLRRGDVFRVEYPNADEDLPPRIASNEWCRATDDARVGPGSAPGLYTWLVHGLPLDYVEPPVGSCRTTVPATFKATGPGTDTMVLVSEVPSAKPSAGESNGAKPPGALERFSAAAEDFTKALRASHLPPDQLSQAKRLLTDLLREIGEPFGTVKRTRDLVLGDLLDLGPLLMAVVRVSESDCELLRIDLATASGAQTGALILPHDLEVALATSRR